MIRLAQPCEAVPLNGRKGYDNRLSNLWDDGCRPHMLLVRWSIVRKGVYRMKGERKGVEGIVGSVGGYMYVSRVVLRASWLRRWSCDAAPAACHIGVSCLFHHRYG